MYKRQGGADESFRSPMAIAVIGGLITSTVLSLLVVPAVFTYVDDFGKGCGRVVQRLRGKAASRSEEATATTGPSAAAAPVS